MKESLARIHVHELSTPETELPAPVAANDNIELPPPQFEAANDNEPLEKEQLAALQERLGIAKKEPVETTREPETPEEIPIIQPEETGQSIKETHVEMVPGHASLENQENQAEAAQAAGGAEQRESGSGGSDNKGSGGGGPVYETSSTKAPSRAATWFKRLLKLPFYVLGATFALFMAAVIKSTNKIFDAAKLTKGEGKSGGGGSKPSGGGGSQGGGGGKGGGGHH